jgi:tRNA threonylcarbamoyladenosine biosynthesis protein TsaE
MMALTFTLATIRDAADRFWKEFHGYKVFAFHGQMGVGKTTFIHALCDAQRVSSTVGSPSFSIINEYTYPAGNIFHIDLYRLKDEEEAIRAGVEDVLYSGNICLVEWAERIPGLFPEDTINVDIEMVDGQTRLMRVEHK